MGWTHKVEPELLCSPLSLSLSIAALTEPSWTSRVNLSLPLGNFAWKKAFQEELDTMDLMQDHFPIPILKLTNLFSVRFTDIIILY